MSGDVDALFKLPLGEFTSARNALAARLKKAGQETEAAALKALRKPSVSAWVVNQLYWRHGDLFERLLEAGARLRQAQATQQPGNLARELVHARQEAVAALRDVAADIVQESGSGAARDLIRRIAASLEALSAYGSLPDAPSAGRLTDDLEPPGFELLAELPPVHAAKSTTRVAPSRAGSMTGVAPSRAGAPAAKSGATKPGRTGDVFDAAKQRREEQRSVAAARAAVREAERALDRSRKQAERAAAKLETAATRADESERQRAEIERRLGRAVKEAEAARDRVRAADADVREATQAADNAERALALARERLETLSASCRFGG
jgi:hypothetical protein